jgi:hypothetical protein
MQSSGSRVDLSTDDQFLELLCADEDLIRAEFDAIVAAAWPGTPPELPGDKPPAGDSGGCPAASARTAEPRLPSRRQHASTSRRRRQRSPPRR